MPIPNSMGIVPPVVGTTPGPTWANELNTILTDKVADHNHTGTPNGGQLSQAALNITGDLPLNNNGLTAAKRVALATQVSSPGAQSLWSNGGNLYWTPAAGSAVQITNGSTINVAAFGGISGLPNGTAGASYNPAGYFKWNKSTTAYADMWAGTLKVFDSSQPAGTYSISVVPPTSIGANATFRLPSVSMTMPTSLPASTGSLLVSPSGVITASAPNAVNVAVSSTAWVASPGTSLATTTYTPTGRRVLFTLQASSPTLAAFIRLNNGNPATAVVGGELVMTIAGAVVAKQYYSADVPATSLIAMSPGFSYVWTPTDAQVGTAVNITLTGILTLGGAGVSILLANGWTLQITDL